MKVLVLVVLCACACVKAAVIEEIGSSVEQQYTFGQLKLAAKSLSEVNEPLDNEVEILISKSGRNVLADRITIFLEGLRDTVVNGNDNIPPLGPLELDHLGPFDYTVFGFRATLNINDLNVDGLQYYVVDYVTFETLRLNLAIHVTIPRLTITGNYDASARLALLITHNAGGDFRILVNRFDIGTDLRLGTNLLGGHLILREFNVNIYAHDVQIRVDGMVGSGLINSVINSYIQNLSNDIIQKELQNLSQRISEELFDTVNDVLKQYTLGDLLGI